MSLVNDALRKARLEATRQDTDRSGAILPTLGQVRQESERPFFSLAVAGLLGLVVIAILTILFFTFIGRENPTIETGQSADLGADPAVSQEPSPQVTSTQSRETTLQPTATAAADPGFAEGRRDSRPASPDATSREERTLEPSRPDRPVEGEVPTEAPPPSETVTTDTPATAQSLRQAPRQATRPTVEPAPRARQAEQSAPASDVATESPAATTGTAAGTTSGKSSPLASQPDPGAETDPAGKPDVASYVRQATVPGIGTFSLEGIAWSSDRPFALINGQVVGPGGFVDGVNLTEVAQDRVVLQKDGRRFELTLR